MAELRRLPIYPQIEQQVLSRRFRVFEDFLRSVGIEPGDDIDEVLLGWRDKGMEPSACLGLAAGRFEPGALQQRLANAGLAAREYNGASLYAFGSSRDPNALFFTFLGESLAAFGRLADLKLMLDVRQGSLPALESNSSFAGWQNELDSTAPQWGILDGQAVGGLVARWVAPAAQGDMDFSALSRNVQALLYRVQWDADFDAQLLLICDKPETAVSLAELVDFLQKAEAAPSPSGASIPSVFQHLEARSDRDRLELNVSGPPEMLDQILLPNRIPMSRPSSPAQSEE